MEDNLPQNLPVEIQAHIKAKKYIDARKLNSPEDIDLFNKILLFAMPKVPLRKFSGNEEPEELHLNNRRFRPPRLYYRVSKYDKWTGQNQPKQDATHQELASARNPEGLNPQAAADVKPVRPVDRANIEIDPDDPGYSDEEEIQGFYDFISDDDDYNDYNGNHDDDDDDDDDDGSGPRAVVVEAALHANF